MRTVSEEYRLLKKDRTRGVSHDMKDVTMQLFYTVRQQCSWCPPEVRPVDMC